MNDRFMFRIWWKKENRYRVDTHIIPVGHLTDFANSDKYVVEQCTGLKDKNDNLIYEGDLIKSPNNSYPLEIVRMSNGVYGCKVHKISPVWEMNLYSLINAYDIEIIGNIHEQPEQKDVKC